MNAQYAHRVGATTADHQYLSNDKSTVSGKTDYQIPIEVNKISDSVQVQQNNPVTHSPTIPLPLDDQCAHGVRVCNGCRNLSNGGSEVHDKVDTLSGISEISVQLCNWSTRITNIILLALSLVTSFSLLRSGWRKTSCVQHTTSKNVILHQKCTSMDTLSALSLVSRFSLLRPGWRQTSGVQHTKKAYHEIHKS